MVKRDSIHNDSQAGAWYGDRNVILHAKFESTGWKMRVYKAFSDVSSSDHS